MNLRKRGIFIAGTGTDIGKTWFSGILVRHLRALGINAGYYKAALSGAEVREGRVIPGDARFVCETAGLSLDSNQLVSYVYRTPVSPAFAAEIEGNPVDLSVVERDFNNLFQYFDYLVTEGSGGIVCPIRRGDQPLWLIDVIRRLNLDILVVADAGLGTINDVVLTLEYARSHHLTVRGAVLNRFDQNDFLHRDNLNSLESILEVPVLACLAPDDLELRHFDPSVIL